MQESEDTLKKKIKFLVAFTLCFSILSNCLMVKADNLRCSNCGGSKWTLYNRESVYQTPIKEHEVFVKPTGLKAICFVYDIYYSETYRCDKCGLYRRETVTEEKHSVDHY